VDGFAHRTLGQEASGNELALEDPMDSCADGPALTAAIRITQRAARLLFAQASFNLVEMADLEQDPSCRNASPRPVARRSITKSDMLT